jgi:hypothetical protein
MKSEVLLSLMLQYQTVMNSVVLHLLDSNILDSTI